MAAESSLGLDTQAGTSPSGVDTVIDEQMRQSWNEHTLDLLLAESGVSLVPIIPKPVPKRLDGSTHRYMPYPTQRPKDQVPDRLEPSSTITMSEGELIVWAASALRHHA